ncbi:endonuclease/exonuclease/phosphatase family protein [Acetobacter musti]|uniref:Endonuclease/exonuclease/phosphatase family protein n=1 Tax=Acetobacter musti TaxID=864732 RepID=A0ABX0JRV7_9PROT|nr:endonuclease/exonuclease/phosphatase family protein [Acetobacter musti]NHN85266.1 endonuclease/exonuclease/phosphatase family protein [Acetobacter musti]
MRILSWNVWSHGTARPGHVGRLVAALQPDFVLLQEATAVMDTLPQLTGGYYRRVVAPGRNNGPAVWSPQPFGSEEIILPPGRRLDFPVAVFRRIALRAALVVRRDGFEIANVHLDHGQFCNRRQLRYLLTEFPALNVIMGDYNAFGPVCLPDFRDVGPRRATHRMYGLVPLRIDRCLVRGLTATGARALAYGPSDHRPVCVDLTGP